MISRRIADHGGKIWVRVSRKKALSVYRNGITVMFCPVNVRPFSCWHFEYTIKRKDREKFVLDEIGVINDFNVLVGSFEYYNCTDNKMGKYAAFYIQEA